jgi:hypothetical protein
LPLIFLGLSVGVRTHLSFRGRRHGHAIDRGRDFVGFEEIFARRRERAAAITAYTLAQSSQKSKAATGRIELLSHAVAGDVPVLTRSA